MFDDALGIALVAIMWAMCAAYIAPRSVSDALGTSIFGRVFNSIAQGIENAASFCISKATAKKERNR